MTEQLTPLVPMRHSREKCKCGLTLLGSCLSLLQRSHLIFISSITPRPRETKDESKSPCLSWGIRGRVVIPELILADSTVVPFTIYGTLTNRDFLAFLSISFVWQSRCQLHREVNRRSSYMVSRRYLVHSILRYSMNLIRTMVAVKMLSIRPFQRFFGRVSKIKSHQRCRNGCCLNLSTKSGKHSPIGCGQ